ncbi:MAG: pantoate--beta-alanine ligase [Nanoarchaeota archaeon]|nr:pantoate--beta-alanine ligase [Nanoarchaeota archaeon]
MLVIKTVKEMQQFSEKVRAEGKTIGFVPTMGYLHDGHLSLARKAKECDVVVASIFVNPTQFGENEDLDAYPRDFERDKTLLEKEGVDVIFYPTTQEMYPEDKLTWVEVFGLTDVLCGASRPTHFRGVTTVVAKLFNIVKPHKAYFGQKDYQQSLVIRKMVKDLNFDVEIVTCPIVREKDGLAMSSRNTYLDEEQRKSALSLSQSLKMAKELIDKGEDEAEFIKEKITEFISKQPFTKIDYVEIVNSENLKKLDKIEGKVLIALAVFVGKPRLIDNMLIEK